MLISELHLPAMIPTRKPRGVLVTEEGQQQLRQAKAAKTQVAKSNGNKICSFERIAEEAPCDEKTVRSFFNRKPVDWDNANAIAQVLDLSLEDLIERPTCHQQSEPDPKPLDWHQVCKSRLAAQKQLLANPANTDSINALIEFLETTEEADACWTAAEILAKIDQGKSTAINTLIKLLLDADNIDNLHWQLKSFVKIAYNDTSAINILTDKIKNSQNTKYRHMAILCLKKIAPDHPATKPVSDSQEFSHDFKSGFNLFMQNINAVERLPDKSAVQVNEIIDLGTIELLAENFDAALSSFLEALALDPRNSYNRLQIVKLYRAKSRDVQAVAMAGFALSLTEETRRRSQLYNIIGRISQEQFERTQCVAYAEQAISAYQSAIESRSDDIVPRWNLVDIYLALSRSGGGAANQNQQYVALAQTELLELKRICFSHQGNYRRYLPEVVKDPSRVLTDLAPWWQEQLDDLRKLAEQIEV